MGPGRDYFFPNIWGRGQGGDENLKAVPRTPELDNIDMETPRFSNVKRGELWTLVHQVVIYSHSKCL